MLQDLKTVWVGMSQEETEQYTTLICSSQHKKMPKHCHLSSCQLDTETGTGRQICALLLP